MNPLLHGAPVLRRPAGFVHIARLQERIPSAWPDPIPPDPILYSRMAPGPSASRLAVERVPVIDSTNSELLRREPLLAPGSGAAAVWLVATRQTAGRGRRQRGWLASPAASLTASFGREIEDARGFGALSLVAGVAVAESLDAFGVAVRLKWPNDLYVARRGRSSVGCGADAQHRDRQCGALPATFTTKCRSTPCWQVQRFPAPQRPWPWPQQKLPQETP